MNKKIMICIALIIIFMMFIFSDNVNAYTIDENIETTIGDKAQLDRGILGFYSIQKKKDDDTWTYITYSIINYIDENGDKHIAYCLDENLFGVGYVKGDVETYEVEIKNLIKDEKIWRVIVNGYPYKTPEELGVETEEDAYIATKRAVYSMISGYTVEDVKENYRVGQTVINGENLEDIKRRGEKIINAILKLVDIGNNGKQTVENELRISRLGEFEKNGENYYQKYQVTSNFDIAEYDIEKIENFPKGTKILDNNGIERTNFKKNETFNIVIPCENIIDDFNGNINISAKCKTYPIYYAEAPEGYQNYAICSGYWNILETNTNLEVETNISTLNIRKIDEDTREPIAGIKFQIKNENNKIIGEYITDENGNINLEELVPGEYYIKEIETIEGYILDEEEKNINIGYNENIEIEIANKKESKANLDIVKKDKETGQNLSGVEFEVKYLDGEKIGNFVTNQDGKIQLNNLNLQTISIKEIKTIEGYELDNNEYIIGLEENKTYELEVLNMKKANQIEKNELLPRTGEDNIKNNIIKGIYMFMLLEGGVYIKFYKNRL
jgi:hypothetical protein